MKIFTKTTEAFRDIINYKKYQKVLKSVYKETDFINALNISFGVEFKEDKVGALYTVINPHIQNMGETGNNIIYDGNGNKMVDQWVVANFNVIDMVIKNHQLFDILSYDIQKLDDDLNYSLVIQNAMYPFYIKARKRLTIRGLIVGLIVLILCAMFL